MSKFSDAVHADLKEVEALGAEALVEVENVLDAAFAAIKPGVLALGKTVLGQVATAAETVIAGKSTAAEALASVEVQLLTDLGTLAVETRAALAAALAAAVASPAA